MISYHCEQRHHCKCWQAIRLEILCYRATELLKYNTKNNAISTYFLFRVLEELSSINLDNLCLDYTLIFKPLVAPKKNDL